MFVHMFAILLWLIYMAECHQLKCSVLMSSLLLNKLTHLNTVLEVEYLKTYPVCRIYVTFEVRRV